MTFKLSDLIKLPEIAKAHTYASENAEDYRIYDGGQTAYKNKLANMEIEVDEEVINVILYAQGILMNYSEDRKRVAHAIASQLPKWLKETK